MPRIVTRAEWGARPRIGPAPFVSIGARTATCTHHDGANVITVRSFAEACARVRADQNYHMDSNGWDDIGYNYLVISAPGVAGVDGLVMEGRGRDVIGAHCLNWNTPWIGIQVAIGGAQKPSPTSLSSVRWLHDTFTSAAKHALGKKVHSDGFNTACPGPELKAWVHGGMPVSGTPVAVPVATGKPGYPGYLTSVKSHGDYVTRMIQTRLRALNYPVVVDGDFGPQTAKWVGLFQSRHHLSADGVVGPATWQALCA